MELPDVDSAVVFGTITMVSWGLWLVLGNAASESIDPRTAAAISYVVAALLAVGMAVGTDASFVIDPGGGLLAGLAGLFAGIGLVSIYLGLSRGSTTVVSTLGAMYFVVAAVIGILVLGEELSLTRAAGIVFAILAVFLVTR